MGYEFFEEKIIFPSAPVPGINNDQSLIAKLILVMPPTNAISERSFSALRRVKIYLRSTMKQTCLNHLMILHVHKEKTDSLNLHDNGNEFVRCSEHRLSVFGHF